MKNTLTIGAALLLTTTAAHAVGLDRSGQPVGIIFEEGNYAELSYGYVTPSVDGTDVATVETGNVGNSFGQLGLGYKQDINDQLSFALILDEPYGADIEYPADSPVLGGTKASLESLALSGLLRYKVDENFSVHGGIRAQQVEAEVTLAGAAFGAPPTPGDYTLPSTTGVGYLVGGAYERKDIALRVALTYISEVEHDFEFTNPLQTVDLTVTTPQSVNLDFQTGIAADTLLFGSVRWAEYSVVQVPSITLGGASLTDIEDGFSYSLGLGRRFSDEFSASLSATLDSEGEDDLVSPLAPTNGSYSVGLGGQYKVNDNVTLSGGARYIVLGDARPETGTPDVPRATFEDNSAVAVGFKVGYSF